MKTNKLKTILLLPLLLALACEQEVITTTPADPDLTNTVVPEPCPAGASAGSASFTKFIAIGNSFVAGVQGGALFTTGQNNSLAAILHKQFQCVGASSTFNQPNINASLGWNLFVTQPFLSDNTKPILGRMLLQYSGATSPKPNPQAYAPGNLEALPNPAANPGFMVPPANIPGLQNFSVAAITVGQVLTPATGNWANPNPAVGFSPFYGRFASAPGTSTILGDAAAAQGTFALVWLGLDDFFLHAAFGGDPTLAPLTSSSDFTTRLGAVFGHPSIGLFTTNANQKAVIGNFPDIFKMPHFTSVTYNPIALPQANVDALNAGFAGYNAALDGLKNPAFGGAFGSAADLDARKVTYAVGNNKILMNDETLTDLGAGFDALQAAGAINAAQRAALVPYENCRQTTAADVIPLSTGSVLGTAGSFGLLGLSEPVGDRYVIIPTEKTAINDARTAFNATVQGIAAAYSTRLAVADVSAAMDAFTSAQVYYGPDYNGLTLTPNINPPTGIYSEDGAHFNTRGYAFISRTFISAINAKFGATIPLTNLAHYNATGLPIP